MQISCLKAVELAEHNFYVDSVCALSLLRWWRCSIHITTDLSPCFYSILNDCIGPRCFSITSYNACRLSKCTLTLQYTQFARNNKRRRASNLLTLFVHPFWWIYALRLYCCFGVCVILSFVLGSAVLRFNCWLWVSAMGLRMDGFRFPCLSHLCSLRMWVMIGCVIFICVIFSG